MANLDRCLNVWDLRDAAKRRLPKGVFEFVDRATEDHIAEVVRLEEGVVHITEVAGQSFTLNANGSNFGQFFVSFAPFAERRDPSLTATAITNRVRELAAWLGTITICLPAGEAATPAVAGRAGCWPPPWISQLPH